jgi:hypothetical protein
MSQHLALRHLLSKVDDEVGNIRRSQYRLPPPNFSYGKSFVKDSEGAKEGNTEKYYLYCLAIQDWRFHFKSREPVKSKDFKSINKIGIQKGLSNARV